MSKDKHADKKTHQHKTVPHKADVHHKPAESPKAEAVKAAPTAPAVPMSCPKCNAPASSFTHVEQDRKKIARCNCGWSHDESGQ